MQRFSDILLQAQRLEHVHLRDLFAQDAGRFQRYHLKQGRLLLDYSKQRVDETALAALMALARDCDLDDWRRRLFTGDRINTSENRAALHTALRDLTDPKPEVRLEWKKMEKFVKRLHAREWRGFTGKPIEHVVNIGVGGSDLGPLMANFALGFEQHPQAPKVYFLSTLDGRRIHWLLNRLNPETTLFIVASKSFSTIDTLSLAETARSWLLNACNDPAWLKLHFIGCSANAQKMTEWGIDPSHQLHFWDWVGGRYSFWSAIGLPIALFLGMAGFMDFLAGAHAMDQHFLKAPFEQNMPVILALLGIWNVNGLNARGQVILPYDERLKFLPAYLEQLEMESNGKRVNRQGEVVNYRTGPILWGEVGPNAQHAFYQLMHQGTEPIVADFIVTARAPVEDERSLYHQKLNLANCLAQSRALMLGQDSDDPFKVYPGNQASNTLVIDQLNAFSLGQLIALYEHKVFVQSVVWDINPFDQWGVELGKKIALELMAAFEGDAQGLDASTQGLMAFIQGRAV
jgi:glucose-6-phosphate isomerase